MIQGSRAGWLAGVARATDPAHTSPAMESSTIGRWAGRSSWRTPEAAQRREQTVRIIDRLERSAASGVISQLLRDMVGALGVQVHVYEYEDAALRLSWTVTFGEEAGWEFRYFVVRRLFAGQELDPDSVYLGPDWTVPEPWLGYNERDLDTLFRNEEVEVRSATAARRVNVSSRGWMQSMQEALTAAYAHPFQSPRPDDRKYIRDLAVPEVSRLSVGSDG